MTWVVVGELFWRSVLSDSGCARSRRQPESGRTRKEAAVRGGEVRAAGAFHDLKPEGGSPEVRPTLPPLPHDQLSSVYEAWRAWRGWPELR